MGNPSRVSNFNRRTADVLLLPRTAAALASLWPILPPLSVAVSEGAPFGVRLPPDRRADGFVLEAHDAASATVGSVSFERTITGHDEFMATRDPREAGVCIVYVLSVETMALPADPGEAAPAAETIAHAAAAVAARDVSETARCCQRFGLPAEVLPVVSSSGNGRRSVALASRILKLARPLIDVGGLSPLVRLSPWYLDAAASSRRTAD